MEGETIDTGIETSVTDELDSDLDLLAASKKGSHGDGYIEQD